MPKKEVKTSKESLTGIVDFFNEKVSFRFFVAAILPIFNFMINGIMIDNKEISSNVINFDFLVLGFLAFFMVILYKILKVKKENKKCEKCKTSAMLIYFMAIFFSVVIYVNGGTSVFFPSFFSAYIVYLASNFDEFDF